MEYTQTSYRARDKPVWQVDVCAALLNDFVQARIQSCFDRIFAAKAETELKRETMIHDRFHDLCEKLSEQLFPHLL